MAILTRPESLVAPEIAVVIVVGGPQYRVGSHRQFTLLARYLAARGVPALRFDYRGMGDSEGESRNFEHVDVDIKAAVDLACERSGSNRIVLWGLCDGASAIMMYAASDRRVAGVACANPWVRNDLGLAKARVKHYYISHLISKSFWLKMFRGKVAVTKSVSEFLGYCFTMVRNMRSPENGPLVPTSQVSFLVRMERGWRSFRGATLFLLSGDDLTAQEFHEWVHESTSRLDLLTGKHCQVARLGGADHTFSTGAWREWSNETTYQWLRETFLRH